MRVRAPQVVGGERTETGVTLSLRRSPAGLLPARMTSMSSLMLAGVASSLGPHSRFALDRAVRGHRSFVTLRSAHAMTVPQARAKACWFIASFADTAKNEGAPRIYVQPRRGSQGSPQMHSFTRKQSSTNSTTPFCMVAKTSTARVNALTFKLDQSPGAGHDRTVT